jgi:L-fucose isomerase
MPVTMSRLNIVKGLGPVLQIAEGVIVDLPAEVHEVLDERTDPTWPTTWFAPRTTGQGPFRDVYSVMYNWGANHGAFSYGHIGADLITLASMLRIPVFMHNVPEEKIYRPSTWASFGAMDLWGIEEQAGMSQPALLLDQHGIIHVNDTGVTRKKRSVNADENEQESHH